MTDLETVASLEKAMEKWIEDNAEEIDNIWWVRSNARYMAIALAQMLWLQRETFLECEK